MYLSDVESSCLETINDLVRLLGRAWLAIKDNGREGMMEAAPLVCQAYELSIAWLNADETVSSAGGALSLASIRDMIFSDVECLDRARSAVEEAALSEQKTDIGRQSIATVAHSLKQLVADRAFELLNERARLASN
ncbi:MAG: hypothetical protein PHT12_04705 [Patescibacteria group bacterium]|nr:hypothetical protein [Patescibacteria group bacterium]